MGQPVSFYYESLISSAPIHFRCHIGKYERNEIEPSIDTTAKIAEALNVTIDYLVKDAEYQNIDDETLKWMQYIEKLTPEDKKPCVRYFKTKQLNNIKEARTCQAY